MSDWKITENNNLLYPPEVLVDDDIIEDDNLLDSTLPESCKVPGVLVYNADYSVIKSRSIDGTWELASTGGGGGGGTSDHRVLTNRDAANQHTIYSITGLQTALDNKQVVISDIETIRSNAQDGADALDEVDVINAKIPTQASSSNQLADKAFVNSSVQTATSNFRGNWDTWADVPTDANDYPVDYAGVKTPSTNDYMVVVDASDFRVSNPLVGTWRFKYAGIWSTDGKNGWNPEYQVNETPLTAVQLAALNSGVTSGFISDTTSALNNTETWTFTLDDDTTVTKQVVVKA